VTESLFWTCHVEADRPARQFDGTRIGFTDAHALALSKLLFSQRCHHSELKIGRMVFGGRVDEHLEFAE
jgi:hypothetical protein